MHKPNLQMKKVSIFILIPLLLSCRAEYKIDSESFDWQPYEIGDKLVFKSNANEVDTIFVKEISSYTNPNDHLALFPDYQTTYFITGEISLINPFTSSIGNKVTKDYVDILKLSSGEETDYLTLNFKKRRDTLSYSEITFKISELESKFENKSKYESIEIDAEYNNDMPFAYDLKTVFWSKEFGYIKYEFKNGNSWNLTEFIRNGENILNE
ncbi:hypothetical protein [Neotamlana laminarinivorans]|uniref:Lipoprotein n=1 Tax=Neotamlana laminarinivorans TaxID=2883124 RepID=A0A9X1L5C4_9FLAO|nr:hypothetical protein [Tamlana laminarinivorans]MCB4800262.1 hypothetical protein [Tamlana laminarinivorans]